MAVTPKIIIDPFDPGEHNTIRDSAGRVREAKGYADLSCVQLCPSRGAVPIRVLSSWFNMMTPMNQSYVRIWASGYEVGDAYSAMIEQVLATPLGDYTFLLTIEEDNVPPPDGLLRLAEAMMAWPQFSAIGGLYWTKGLEGQPMIYGNPKEVPLNFRPQAPIQADDNEQGAIQECCGLGMGFTMFRLSMFRDEKIARPWFETVQRVEPGVGMRSYTQDLWFFEKARLAGHRFAVHTGVRVGHYDGENDIVW